MRYYKEGFPQEYGLLECGIIVTDLHNDKAKTIYDEWWNEFMREQSGRDQLSIPYVLWKKGISPSEIGTLGNNLYFEPKFRIVPHK